MESSNVLVADAKRRLIGELLLDLKRGLLGVGVRHVRINSGEVDEDSGGEGASS